MKVALASTRAASPWPSQRSRPAIQPTPTTAKIATSLRKMANDMRGRQYRRRAGTRRAHCYDGRSASSSFAQQRTRRVEQRAARALRRGRDPQRRLQPRRADRPGAEGAALPLVSIAFNASTACRPSCCTSSGWRGRSRSQADARLAPLGGERGLEQHAHRVRLAPDHEFVLGHLGEGGSTRRRGGPLPARCRAETR